MPLVRKGGVLTTLAKAVKADPIGGSVLVDEVVYSFLADQAEYLRPDIERLMAGFVADRAAIAKRALGRAYVESTVDGHYPSDDVHKAAEWIAGIEKYAEAVVDKYDVSKADRNESWVINGETVRRQVSRDARGRFSASINTSATRDPLSARSVSPKLLGSRVVESKRGRQYTDDAKGQEQVLQRHQAQWEEASGVVRDLYNSFGTDRKGVNVDLTIIDAQGKARNESFALDGGRKGLPESVNVDPVNDNILQVQVSTTDPEMAPRVAQFNALGAVGGTALARFAQVPEQSWMETFGRYDMRPENGTRLSQFFNRVRAGADVLNAVPGADKLSRMASLVGTMGPEAERVLSPYVRQAAYRYRGTEKEPDLELVRAFNSNAMNAVNAAAEQGSSSEAAARLGDGLVADAQGRKPRTDIVVGSAAHRIGEARRQGRPFTEDELKLQVRSDVAARHLMNTLPDDPFVAEVSRKAGDVLPSQGVLIDSDGDVVSQAVGYADDHYLPFDLKNLASLRGGQYVRTRVQGGLTAEDIYASVAMGSRMSTVVSSSGVYSIEFDPNFRGGRANSDKARQMYDRYIKILDAVEGSGLYTQDLPPAQKAKIRAEAKEMAGPDDDWKDIERSMLERARAKEANVDDETLNRIQEEARAEAMAVSGTRSGQELNRIAEDIFNEKLAEAQEARVQALRLNSEGYKVALETLQQQFPYFIRSVTFEPLGSKKGGFLESRGQDTRGGVRQRSAAEDKGYVAPGELRPGSVGFKRKSRGSSEPAADTAASETESSSTGGATTAPAASAQAKPASQAAPAPQKGVSARYQQMAPVIEQRRAEALKEFSNILPSLGLDESNFGVTDWNQVRGTANAIRFIGSRPPAEMQDLIQSDPEGVISALNDEKQVANFLRFALNQVGASDFFESGGKIGDASSPEEAAAYLKGLAGQIVDLSMLSNPFDEMRGSGEAVAFHDGTRPQAFKEIIGLDTPGKFKAYKDANPDQAEMAVALGFGPDGYLPMGEVARRAQALIESQKKIGMAQDAVMAALKANDYDIDKTKIEPALASVGLTREQVESAIGKPIKSAVDMNRTAYDPMREAEKVQRAWSLVTAARLLEDLDGGDVLPKAQDAVLLKNFAVGRSSRQVVTVSKHHPLSLEIQRRRALGLPLLPTRN